MTTPQPERDLRIRIEEMLKSMFVDHDHDNSWGTVEKSKEILTLISEVVSEVIGPDLRHATSTKQTRAIEEDSGGVVSEDEILDELQKNIDAQNSLRDQQRAKLKSLLEDKVKSSKPDEAEEE